MIPQGSIGQFRDTVANGNCEDEDVSNCPHWVEYCPHGQWTSGKHKGKKSQKCLQKVM